MHGPQLSKSALLLGGRAGGRATIIENLGSMGIITLQNGERFACNPTKGFPSNFMKGINLLY